MNRYSLDLTGFHGAGYYNIPDPREPFGDRVPWAERGLDGLIHLRKGEAEPVYMMVNDAQFREARDWPTSIGNACVVINGAVVNIVPASELRRAA